MHKLFSDETGLWKVDLLVDSSDNDKINLIKLSENYGIPIDDIKKRFRDIFQEEELSGCANIQYTAATDSYHAEIFFTEHLHNQDIEIVSIVRDLNYPLPLVILSFEEQIFENDKKGMCKTKASQMSQDLKKIIEENFLKKNKEIQDIHYDPKNLFRSMMLKPKSRFLRYDGQFKYSKNDVKILLHNIKFDKKQSGVCCLVKKLKKGKIVNEPFSTMQVFNSENYIEDAKQYYDNLEDFVKKHYVE